MLSPAITRRLMDRVAVEAATHERAQAALARLTDRERDVALVIAKGHTNAEIAVDLYMSVATVKAHVSRILTKLTHSNRTQIALLATTPDWSEQPDRRHRRRRHGPDSDSARGGRGSPGTGSVAPAAGTWFPGGSCLGAHTAPRLHDVDHHPRCRYAWVG